MYQTGTRAGLRRLLARTTKGVRGFQRIMREDFLLRDYAAEIIRLG
jgi:hypothetical protein